MSLFSLAKFRVRSCCFILFACLTGTSFALGSYLDLISVKELVKLKTIDLITEIFGKPFINNNV
jgi:hypothetical protein